MLNLTYDIKIGKFKVKNLISAKILKSADEIADTAEIILPGMVYGKTMNVEDKIKVGNSVIIKLGYQGDGYLFTELEGYLESIETENTIKLKVMDSIHLLKKDGKNKQYSKASIKYIIDDQMQGRGFKISYLKGAEGIVFEKFTVQDSSIIDVLNKLKEETGLQIYCRAKNLFVSLPYFEKRGRIVYDFSKNVEKSNLKYKKKEDRKLEIEMVSIKKDGKRDKVYVGEKGGDKKTIYKYNIEDIEKWKQIGENELVKYVYDGFEGAIDTWLLPYASYGYTAKIKDDNYPKREGIYHIDAVETTFDSSGGKRVVTLGKKLD